MKSFNYTARDKAGGMKRGNVQAADRNAALYELTAQGLVPLSVTQGNAKPSGSISVKPIHVIAGLVAVSAVVLAMIFLVPGKLSKKNTGKKSVPSVKATVVPKQRSKPTTTSIVVDVSSTNVIKSTTSSYHKLTTETKVLSESNANTNLVLNEPKRPADFPSGLEQVMNWVVNKRLGDTPFLLPNLSLKENTVEILERNLVVYDDDTEDKFQAKANVAQAKQMLKEYIAQGGTPEGFLSYYHTELVNANRQWLEAQKQVGTLLKTGDREAAQAYAEEVNKLLAEKGIKPVIGPR